MKGSCGFQAIWEDGAGEKSDALHNIGLGTISTHLIRSRIEARQNNRAHISYDGSDA